MLVNFLAHHLSKAQRQAQRQSKELARLETLGEALLKAPADASTLPAILEELMPALFPQDRLEIRLFEKAGKLDLPILHQVYPPHLTPFTAEIWDRIQQTAEPYFFVTVFYGILDRESGLLIYANAGHNPGYLIHQNGNGQPTDHTSALKRTGIPLGMFPDMAWEQAQVVIHPGDLLFLYSDGVTEAQNRAGELFEDERLLAVGRARNGRNADEIQTAVLDAIHTFVGDAPHFDDITLLVVTRNNE